MGVYLYYTGNFWRSLFCLFPFVTVENCIFKDNNNLCGDFTNESTTSLGRGGAISVLNGGYLNVHDSTFGRTEI